MPSLTSSQAAPLIEDATMADVAQALEMVMAGHGRSMDEGRIKTVALLVLDQGWKRAELQAAARVLANDPEVRDHLRYGGTISSADFEAVRRGDERRERGEDGEPDRVITTLRGYALKVRRNRLYTHPEAFGLWVAAGQPGSFSDAVQRDGALKTYPDSMFTVVEAGEVGRRFQLK